MMQKSVKKNKVNIIAAVSANGVIGKNNDLPWHIPEDLKYFKQLTKQNIVIMGKNTFISLGSKALPLRTNFVVSSSMVVKDQPYFVFPSLEKALELSHTIDDTEIFIIGGRNLFKEALEKDIVDDIHLTEIREIYDGDVFFPKFDKEKYHRIEHPYNDWIYQDTKNNKEVNCGFVTYSRKEEKT